MSPPRKGPGLSHSLPHKMISHLPPILPHTKKTHKQKNSSPQTKKKKKKKKEKKKKKKKRKEGKKGCDILKTKIMKNDGEIFWKRWRNFIIFFNFFFFFFF